MANTKTPPIKLSRRGSSSTWWCLIISAAVNALLWPALLVQILKDT